MTATCATCGERIHVTRLGGHDELWEHDLREHRGQQAEVTQMPAVTWHEQAMQGIKTLALSGKPFVISDVISLGVPDAPHPRTDWPRVTNEARDLGWIEQTGRLGHSARPSTKGSPVAEWRGTTKARNAA